jgi:type IV pilus assembly protein PilE
MNKELRNRAARVNKRDRARPCSLTVAAPTPLAKHSINGFTLIELVIALSIVIILTVSSMSIYSYYVRKGRRIDAVNSIMSISLAEERYRSNNTSYGTLAQVWGGVTTSSEGYYTLAISNVSATAYTITATATGDQANDKSGSTSCTPLQLQVSNGTVTKSPAVCWPT